MARIPRDAAGFVLAAAVVLMPTPILAQDPVHCREAHRFLTDEIGMRAITTPDTIDDWRTKTRAPGCRVTAAGLTTLTLEREARSFYERLRAAGWTRTPDPMDAPNEAALRFRRDASDCLFNFYSGGLLGTEAEARVDEATVPGPGQRRYNFLVLCMAVQEAAPRDASAPPSDAQADEVPSTAGSKRVSCAASPSRSATPPTGRVQLCDTWPNGRSATAGTPIRSEKSRSSASTS